MKVLKQKIIYELIGIFSIFIAGLIFVLVTDVKLKLTSGWLFLAIIISFGSGIFATVANINKEKLKFFFTFKALGLALTFGYIAFLIVYLKSDVFPKTQALKGTGNFVFTFCLILTIVSIIFQGVHIVLNIVNQEDIGAIESSGNNLSNSKWEPEHLRKENNVNLNKKDESRTLAICALVFSILGGLVGLILSIISTSISEDQKNKKISIVSLIISIFWFVLAFILEIIF